MTAYQRLKRENDRLKHTPADASYTSILEDAVRGLQEKLTGCYTTSMATTNTIIHLTDKIRQLQQHTVPKSKELDALRALLADRDEEIHTLLAEKATLQQDLQRREMDHSALLSQYLRDKQELVEKLNELNQLEIRLQKK